MKFELVVNLKIAKALGHRIPPSIPLRVILRIELFEQQRAFIGQTAQSDRLER